MATYSLTPIEVPPVDTKYRTIKTMLPVPESVVIIESLKDAEPQSMMGQPPVVWHSAEDVNVCDRWGNRWLDWSSCVLVTNVGHGRQEIKDALHAKIDQGLLSTYVFVHEDRVKLTRKLQAVSPDPAQYHVFLLSTGSEATENCIKLSKTYAMGKHGPEKKFFVTFDNAFHGRTMGSQLAGGTPAQKEWMGQCDSTFVQVPFPDGFRNEDTDFELFLKTLKEKNVAPENIAGIMSESYQGCGPYFMPVEYAQKLAEFCGNNDIVLTMDEVQAGFGRTGRMFTFEHYGIRPDLIACGKGITSSLPLSAVIGRKDIMGLYAPGSMTSTHSASPLCVTAALASMELLEQEDIISNAAAMGEILVPEIQRIAGRFPKVLGCATGKGLVAGIQVIKEGTREPDPDLALAINLKCFHKGLLMFAPVGVGGACVKIAPPLTVTEEPLREGIATLEEAVDEVLG